VYTRALGIWIEKYGMMSLHVGATCKNLSSCLVTLSRYEEASRFQAWTVEIYLKHFGMHIESTRAIFEYGQTLAAMEQWAAASDCLLLALHMVCVGVARDDHVKKVVRTLIETDAGFFHVRAPPVCSLCVRAPHLPPRADASAQLLCAAGRFQDALPYFTCIEPMAVFNKDTLQPYLGLFFSAGAEMYRRCDMPSRALDCLRRALVVYRSAPVDVCRDAVSVRDLDLWMRVAGLSVSVDRVTDEIEKTEARIKARGDRPEPLPPSVYDVPAPSLALRTVRACTLGSHPSVLVASYGLLLCV